MASQSGTNGVQSRNGSLDILRSFAIIVVVNCHVAMVFAHGPTRSAVGLGGKGVDLFFALSGWLLGQQLLKELANSGTIDVRRFWFRRWFRTLPAYYAVLIVTYLWRIAIQHDWNLDLTYLFFGQTYLSPMPYFGVSWSLCVEEHFYLMIAPLLLILNRRWGLPVLIALLATPAAARMLGWYGDIIQTHVRWDQCGVGVLLAFLSVYCPRAWKFLCRIALPLALLGAGAMLANLYWRLHPDLEMADLDIGIWLLVAASFVLLGNASPLCQSKLQWRLTRYVADRSYSLYLLHIEAIVIIAKLSSSMSFPVALALTWLLSFCLAEVLYRLVERPGMRLREYWAWSACHSRPSELTNTDVPVESCSGQIQLGVEAKGLNLVSPITITQ